MLSVFHKYKPFLSLSTSAIRGMASSPASNKKLDGKVAIVTAATEGIGFAIARRLAQDGASVVLSSRKQENVDKAVKQLKDEGLDVDGIQCHVGREDHRNNLIEHTVKSKGGIDILVSNAAANPAMGPTLDCSESVWDKLFEINVKAAFLLSKLVVPEMEKRKGGSIVYISSIGGYQPLPAIGPYCVTKTALLGLTKALAIELAYSNIRVNCVAPGVIKTKFSQQLTDVAPEMALERIPLNRFGEPKEVASVVSFLCSDDASYITGESIAPAGGYYSRL